MFLPERVINLIMYYKIDNAQNVEMRNHVMNRASILV